VQVVANHGAGNAARNFVVNTIILQLGKNWRRLKNTMMPIVVSAKGALNKRITVVGDTIVIVIKDGDTLGGWLLN
jgi:hypothetical protein